jgi:hypothetical protein
MGLKGLKNRVQEGFIFQGVDRLNAGDRDELSDSLIEKCLQMGASILNSSPQRLDDIFPVCLSVLMINARSQAQEGND